MLGVQSAGGRAGVAGTDVIEVAATDVELLGVQSAGGRAGVAGTDVIEVAGTDVELLGVQSAGVGKELRDCRH